MNVKPLAIITSYNRRALTEQMLASLIPSLAGLDVVIVDNGSDDGSLEVIAQWVDVHGGVFIPLSENIGCPRALNLALQRHRRPGQPVIKLDNDILLPANGKWLLDIRGLLYAKARVGLVSAHYDEWNTDRVLYTESFKSKPLHLMKTIVGHAVYHSGPFMDVVGYFDVLHADHLYGFEDNLLSVKAKMNGWQMLAWEGWKIRNLQRHSALGPREDMEQHIATMRPYYERRAAAIARERGTIRTGPDGYPARMG